MITSNTIIRPAEKKDCERMMELIRELALYEKSPDEVTVNFDKVGIKKMFASFAKLKRI